MAKITIKAVWNRNNRASASNPQNVKIEVYSTPKRVFIPTEVYLYPGEWDDETKEVVNRQDRHTLNMKIQNLIDSIIDYIQKQQKVDKEVTIKDIQNRFTPGKANEPTFLDWMAHHIEERNDICENTKVKHRIAYRTLIQSNIIKDWNDLTPAKCRQYDNYLRETITQQTTLYGYHKIVKAYINEANRLEIKKIDNPYQVFRVKRGQSAAIKYLSEEELNLIKSAELPSHLLPIRDLFLFACYTGLAWSDLAKFDFKDCVKENGRWVCEDFREKNGSRYKIVIMAPAIAIVQRYGGKLPEYSYEYYNAQLKMIALYAGLGRKLTTHMARHTFATLAISKGVHISVVQRMLAHKSARTTEIYAKVLQRDVFSGYDILEGVI